jgi:hypothetical protein
MNLYAFGKNRQQPQPKLVEPKLKIYCNVAFCNKDDAKSKGAKWDADNKKWFFKLDYKEFKENKKIHTYTYPPIQVEFIGDIKATEDNILAVIKFRNIQYSIKNIEYI